jgi:hypothetical protein
VNPSPNRCLLAFALVSVLSGCTAARRGVQRVASSHLADTATSYNLAIEQTEDEMLLLNVIRAQDHYPLYVTDASKVTGTVKADISLGLKIPLAHAGGANDYVGMPVVEYSSSPSMDVNLLNGNDFMAGFLTPIPTELFSYYWDLGWGAEFLLYLLVLKVEEFMPTEVKDKPMLVYTWRNQPDVDDSSLSELAEFSQWVNDLVKDGRPRICYVESAGAPIGPTLEIKDWEALKLLVPALKEGYSLGSAGEAQGLGSAAATGRWQLIQPKKRTFFLCPPGTEENPTDIPTAMIEALASPTDPNRASLPKSFVQTRVAATTRDGHFYRLTLRSPEGMLYYLGELTRLANPVQAEGPAEANAGLWEKPRAYREAQAGKKRPVGRVLLIHYCDLGTGCGGVPGDKQPRGAQPLVPLFVALDRNEHGECTPIIWVRSMDEKDYLIPNSKAGPGTFRLPEGGRQLVDATGLCDPGQSMHALTLLSQLIGLHKAAKDISTTSTVKVVGQ